MVAWGTEKEVSVMLLNGMELFRRLWCKHLI